ncbi:MAG: phospholipase D-like domain-containing protein, partial [Rhodoferax sp.]
KVAVVDGHWATVGSSNLDPLSLLLAREANVVVDDVIFAQDLRNRLEEAIRQGSIQIDPAAYSSRPWHQRFLDRVAFGLTRVLLFLYGKRY